MTTLAQVITLSAILFSIGVYGALTRRNAVGILISVEIMLNSANLNFIGFSYFAERPLLTGQMFAIFVIAVAAAEITLGLALVLAVYKNIETIDIQKMNIMKG